MAMAKEVTIDKYTASAPSRGKVYLGGPRSGCEVVPVTGTATYSGADSVLFKNCDAKPADGNDLTNKRYVDDSITSVINSIEGLGNISHTSLSAITNLIGEQNKKGSILNNALVIQAFENSLGMDIADNLSNTGTSDTTNINSVFIPSLKKNTNESESTDFSLNSFLSEVREGPLDSKVLGKKNPTLANHLNNLYTKNNDINKVIGTATDGILGSIDTHNSQTTINGQIGNLFDQLAGPNGNITVRTNLNSGKLETVDTQLNDLYSRVGNSTTKNSIATDLKSVQDVIGGTDGSIVAQGSNTTINQQLSFLYDRLTLLYQYFLNHDLNTEPGNVPDTTSDLNVISDITPVK